MVIRTRDFFLLPNLLAIFRILILPFIFYFLAQDTQADFVTALILIILAIASDVLDGYTARRLNQVTDLGKILDPVADKLGLAAFVIFIIIHRGFPIWTAGLLFFKDILTLIAGVLMVKRRGMVLMSTNWGKLNSWIWVITVIVFIIQLRQLEPLFIILATLSVIKCLAQYFRLFLTAYRSESSSL
jgi:cardiolipin synthase